MITPNCLFSFKNELSKIAEDSLNGKVHEEREKRIKLKELPKECLDIDPIVIKQGVIQEIKKGDDVICYARIRSKKLPGKPPKYSLGVKHFPLNQESEAEISKDIFNAFYPDNLKKPQEKNRYALKNGWDVDKTTDGKIVAEYEHSKGDKIEIPEHWNILKD